MFAYSAESTFARACDAELREVLEAQARHEVARAGDEARELRAQVAAQQRRGCRVTVASAA